MWGTVSIKMNYFLTLKSFPTVVQPQEYPCLLRTAFPSSFQNLKYPGNSTTEVKISDTGCTFKTCENWTVVLKTGFNAPYWHANIQVPSIAPLKILWAQNASYTWWILENLLFRRVAGQEKREEIARSNELFMSIKNPVNQRSKRPLQCVQEHNT